MSVDLITQLTVFALAVFVGFEVISKVPTMLHTPLMSGTNAIHGIVVVGAIIVVGEDLGGTSPPCSGSSPSCSAPSTWSVASSSPTACSRCSGAGRPRRRRNDVLGRHRTGGVG